MRGCRVPEFLAVLVILCLFAPGAIAESYKLSGQQRWLTVASTQDFDPAKGIAAYYAWKKAAVMKSENGWFAVVMGPFAATDMKTLGKIEADLSQDLPADALLSKGDRYIEKVWQGTGGERSGPLVTYGKDKPARFSAGSLNFEVSLSGDEDNPGPTMLSGRESGKSIFSFETNTDWTINDSQAGLVRLDGNTEAPQLVAQRWSGGAHCCTGTWIATKPNGAEGWTLIDTGMLDGGGIAFEDLNGDSVLEMLSPDNAFLYAFSSYAESVAPLRIKQLAGGAIQDVTLKPEFKGHVRQNLATFEFATRIRPEIKESPGYLAGWVALKMILGEGDEAWRVMMQNFKQDDNFGPQECTTGGEPENCAPENLRAIPFPTALARFLAELEYGPLPKAAQGLLK